jgi:hypothetical protein
MNEMTSTGHCPDGRVTGGLKGLAYDVFSYARSWDESLVLTDGDVRALLETAS